MDCIDSGCHTSRRAPSFSPREGYGLHPRPHQCGPGHPCVSVPVRGMDCIQVVPINGDGRRGFSPREGYGLHPPTVSAGSAWTGFSPREGYGLHRVLPGLCQPAIHEGFSPREGYGLHPGTAFAGAGSADVSVPVRGMDCILYSILHRKQSIVSVPVRGMDCIVASWILCWTHRVSVPVRGMDCIRNKKELHKMVREFQSP